MNTSLTSNKPATKDQVRRVRTLTTEAIEEALDQVNLTHDQVQAVHANGGVYKQEFAGIFTKFVRNFSRKALGLVVPQKAQDTGLVPEGWDVVKDDVESEINLGKLDYSACPVRGDEEYISGETMMKRARELGAIGSLGFAADLLKAQDQGKEIFPAESRGVHHFIMPLTELRDGDSGGGVAGFGWGGERWRLYFRWLDYYFDRDDRFVRRSE